MIGFDNRYFMERVRGRGSKRRHLDMVCRSEGRVARLQLSFDERHRIDQSGLWVDFTSVLGCTSNGWRRTLETSARRVHLCRNA